MNNNYSNKMKEFKASIAKCILLLALFSELISLIVIRFNIQFALGLALGAAVSIANFNIMYIAADKTLSSGNNKYGFLYNFLGYIIRLILYGGCLVFSASVSSYSGIGTAIGFVLLFVAIYIVSFKKRKPIKEVD